MADNPSVQAEVCRLLRAEAWPLIAIGVADWIPGRLGETTTTTNTCCHWHDKSGGLPRGPRVSPWTRLGPSQGGARLVLARQVLASEACAFEAEEVGDF